MLQKERNQILGAQKEDIQKLAALVEAVLSDDQICVVGSETAIEGGRCIHGSEATDRLMRNKACCPLNGIAGCEL